MAKKKNKNRPGRPKLTTWARDFRKCRTCKTTTRKHYAHGLCEDCYRRQYNRAWIASYRERQRAEA